MRNLDSKFHSAPRATGLELVLRTLDGSPWRLTVSPGIERFIGHYPLVDGIDAGGPLLSFRAAEPS